MSEELTRFPTTPQERHQTAKSSDDVRAVPDEDLPRTDDRPQDKPLPPTDEIAGEDTPDEPGEDPRDD